MTTADPITPRTVVQSLADAYRHLMLACNHLTHLQARPDSEEGTKEAAQRAEEAVTKARLELRLERERLAENGNNMNGGK